MPPKNKVNPSKIFSHLLRRWYWGLAAGLVIAITLFISFAMHPRPTADGTYATYPYGLTTTLEDKSLDLLFQLRDLRRPDVRERGRREPITIIRIDEKSIAASGVRLQKWSRAFYAKLVKAASDGGAAVIGLDIVLSEAGGITEDDRAGDAQLIEAMAEAGSVVIVEKLEAGGTQRIKPLPEFAEAAYATGFADTARDADTFIRSMMLARLQQNAVSNVEVDSDLSFASRLAEGYLLARHVAEEKPVEDFYAEQGLSAPPNSGVVNIGGRTLPLRTDLMLQLDFRGRSPGFRYVAAGDILADDPAALSEDLYRDRIVLIGATNVDAPDMFSTPFFQPNELARFIDPNLPTTPALMPGVEVHANTVATLLWGNTLARPSFAWRVFCVALPLVLAGLAIFALRRALPALLIILFIAASLLVVSSWAFNSYGLILPLASAWLAVGILAPAGLGLRYAHERTLRDETEAERAQLMDIFSRCVSENVAETLWQQRDKLLQGERRVVTIVFTDIRGFTTISEGIPSLRLVEILNGYFARMNAIVDHHCGHINKFIGDGLMIVFGAPISRGDAGEAWAAVSCGLEMLQEVEAMNEEAEAAGRPRIQIGVGIHTGEATCGVVGSERRLEYTIIGDTVNLAARLESTTKEFHVPLLMSAATEKLVSRRFETRALGEVTVKGKTASTSLFTVVERRKTSRYGFKDGVRQTAANKLPKTFPVPANATSEIKPAKIDAREVGETVQSQ